MELILSQAGISNILSGKSQFILLGKLRPMEKINAVEMVRTIRDKLYEETKKMSREKFERYYKENGGKALSRLRRTAKTPHSPAA
jgi:hypothetical protein